MLWSLEFIPDTEEHTDRMLFVGFLPDFKDVYVILKDNPGEKCSNVHTLYKNIQKRDFSLLFSFLKGIKTRNEVIHSTKASLNKPL